MTFYNTQKGLKPQNGHTQFIIIVFHILMYFLENGYTKEEMKMINETRKILENPDLKITATTVRVPVLNSHSESINIEFENNFDIKDIYTTLENYPELLFKIINY